MGDNSTVEHWQFVGSSDCNATGGAVSSSQLNFEFDPVNHPDRDTFECRGDPCPYYIIEDGTAHPEPGCPFDTGSGGNAAGHYATWHVKLILEGCQSDGQTSVLLACSSTNGITQLNFDNPTCDYDGYIGNETLPGGAIDCVEQTLGRSTGRSFYCSEETTTTTTTTTTTLRPTTDSPTADTTTTTTTTTTAIPTTATPTADTTTTTTTTTTATPTTMAPTTATPITAAPITNAPTTNTPTTTSMSSSGSSTTLVSTSSSISSTESTFDDPTNGA